MKNKKIGLKIISGTLLCSMCIYTSPVFAYTKDETVYSKLDSTGSSYNTIVTSHIENTDKNSTIKDISDLLNIENTNGDEKFNQDGNSLVWETNKGGDIYYKGESNKELPVDCKIRYELDGKEIEAKELAGKSGTVKITLEYTNKDEHIVNINGKNVKMYTPFVAVAGTVVENDKNSNIEVSNGKIINDGTKSIIMGVAMPGLQESLGVSKSTLDIPDSIEITMDATDFESSNIMTFVTPKIFEESDLSAFEKLDELYEKVDTIESSMNQIQDGANTLKDGANKLSEKSQQFNNAMNKVADGMSSANSNYSQIDNGISKINSSTQDLKNGANQISTGSQAVDENLQKIVDTLTTIETGTNGMVDGENKMSAGLEKIIAGVDAISVEENGKKITDLKNLVERDKEIKQKLTDSNIKLQVLVNNGTDTTGDIATQIAINTQTIGVLEKNIQANNEAIALLQATDVTSINALKQGLKDLKDGLSTLQGVTKKVNDGVTGVKAGASTLTSENKKLVAGAQVLAQGTSDLKTGTSTLNAGSTSMKTGLNILASSTSQLTEADGQLTEGTKTVAEGANTLAKGVSTFNEEGIKKICDYINGDVKDIATRVEKLTDLAKKYNNFTMLEDGNEGNVKFVAIIDGIKKEDE